MSEHAENLARLQDAAARNATVVLSVPTAGMVRSYKTRFLGDEEGGFWIEIVDGAADLLDHLRQQQQPVAVSFNLGTRRISFASQVIRVDHAFNINTTTTAPAALIAKPNEIRGVQRRNAYRVRVPLDNEMVTRVWIISEHAHISDRPLASQELKVEVFDISTGGLGVTIVAPDNAPVSLANDQRLRVELKFEDIDLVLDARLRTGVKVEAKDKQRNGVVFKKLESDLEGRQKLAALTRIVGELQRDEVKRARWKLAS